MVKLSTAVPAQAASIKVAQTSRKERINRKTPRSVLEPRLLPFLPQDKKLYQGMAKKTGGLFSVFVFRQHIVARDDFGRAVEPLLGFGQGDKGYFDMLRRRTFRPVIIERLAIHIQR